MELRLVTVKAGVCVRPGRKHTNTGFSCRGSFHTGQPIRRFAMFTTVCGYS